MIDNYETYSNYVRGILKKVPILKTGQLISALMSEYEDKDMDAQFALAILHAIQRNGHVLLSSGGWAMTKGAYRMYSKDKFGTAIESNADFRLGDKISVFSDDQHRIVQSVNMEKLLSNKDLKMIDCMWVVADLMPLSEHFIIGTDPWNLIFVSEDDAGGTCYEVVKINETSENATIEMLRNTPRITDHEMRDSICRIAVLDSADHAWKVPYIGFTHICVLDKQSETGYSVIETRGDDRWSDYD